MEENQKFTTLDLVLRQANGAVILPLKVAARLLGCEPQTCRNQICAGSFLLPIIKANGRVFVRAQDLAEKIDALATNPSTVSRRGRPRKSEIAARGAT